MSTGKQVLLIQSVLVLPFGLSNLDSIATYHRGEIFNTRRMHRRVTVVVLCVCVRLSVTKQAAIYLVCECKVWRYKVPYGIPNTICVDFTENALFAGFGIIC